MSLPCAVVVDADAMPSRPGFGRQVHCNHRDHLRRLGSPSGARKVSGDTGNMSYVVRRSLLGLTTKPSDVGMGTHLVRLKLISPGDRCLSIGLSVQSDRLLAGPSLTGEPGDGCLSSISPCAPLQSSSLPYSCARRSSKLTGCTSFMWRSCLSCGHNLIPWSI